LDNDACLFQDPDASNEDMDILLVRQFQSLGDSLVDDCPAVRVVAAQGVCHVLNLYWEIIPSATTASFVSKLVGEASIAMIAIMKNAVVLQACCYFISMKSNIPKLLLAVAGLDDGASSEIGDSA
jgi:hypothetical protein